MATKMFHKLRKENFHQRIILYLAIYDHIRLFMRLYMIIHELYTAVYDYIMAVYDKSYIYCYI